MSTQDLYLSLLKKSLLNQLYLDNELRIQYLLECIANKNQFQVAEFLDPFLYRARQAQQLRKKRRLGWAGNDQMEKMGYSRTMLGEARLDNIEFCIKDVIAKNIPGDLIEYGAWRGGGSSGRHRPHLSSC